MVIVGHCVEHLDVMEAMDLELRKLGLQISRFENFVLRIDRLEISDRHPWIEGLED